MGGSESEGSELSGRELNFYRARRVVKQFTRRVGQVFAHCSAIRSPSFVVISTLSFPCIPVQEDLLLHSHPPIKKVRANERASFVGGSESEERAFREGVELLSSSSRREAIYLSRRIGIHVIARLSQSVFRRDLNALFPYRPV